MLGDNRDNSSDSRYWGFLPIDQVKGRALHGLLVLRGVARGVPSTGMEWVRDTLSAFGKTRWRRFFH